MSEKVSCQSTRSRVKSRAIALQLPFSQRAYRSSYETRSTAVVAVSAISSAPLSWPAGQILRGPHAIICAMAFALTALGAMLAVGLELLEALAIVLAGGSSRRRRGAPPGALWGGGGPGGPANRVRAGVVSRRPPPPPPGGGGGVLLA